MRILLLLISLFYSIGSKDPALIVLKDLQGKPCSLPLTQAKKATIIFFLSPECPLCESYSLTIRNLQSTYQAKGFQFIAIIPGTDYSIQQIVVYRNKYNLKSIPFYLDEKLELVKLLGATITPEVFVILPKKEVVYHGRIDNWAYELAKKRKVITEYDLRDVLSAISQNKNVKPYQTKAVGCFIN